jgi:eukaryotic-like serine/threonine-protein kinase
MRQLGRYRLLEELGSGGFAVVYKAEISGPEGFRSRFAIKRIHPFLTHNQPGFINTLTNEARLCARFEHPNVVRVTELDSVPDEEGQEQYYMVMELVDGVTLDVLLRMTAKRRERLPPNVVVDLLLQIARGLAYVHALKDEDGRALKMVHRDLKPSNILISREGVAKIFDFGIAKAINSSGPRTATGVTRGTAAFMSPEQAYGKPVDFACDLFAFGAILFELTVGEQLIVGDSMAAQLMTVVNTPADFRAKEVEASIAGLGAMFQKLRQPRAKDRYKNTTELIEELRRLRRILESDMDPQAYLTRLYDDPDAQVSQEEIAHYKVMQHERVPSTATFFEVPGYRRNRSGKLVPTTSAAESWGVDIAEPSAVTRETEALEEPDDIELETYTGPAVRRFKPAYLLLVLIPVLVVVWGGGVVVSRLLLHWGLGSAATTDVSDHEEPVTAAAETADVVPDAGDEPVTDDAVAQDDAAEPTPEPEQATEAQIEPVTEAEAADAGGEEPATEEVIPEETGEPATLKINAYPAATVFIDGSEAGSTFVTARGVTLSPGEHHIRMVRSNDGFEQNLSVTLEEGQTLVVPFKWEPAEAPETQETP